MRETFFLLLTYFPQNCIRSTKRQLNLRHANVTAMYIAVLYMIRLFMHQSPPKIQIPMIIDILTAASYHFWHTFGESYHWRSCHQLETRLFLVQPDRNAVNSVSPAARNGVAMTASSHTKNIIHKAGPWKVVNCKGKRSQRPWCYPTDPTRKCGAKTQVGTLV